MFKIGQKYDVVIFQKAYHTEFMKVFPGIKILDICDPDWLETKPVKESAELCDAVTCSSEALCEYMRKITNKPVFFIPDRVDLETHLFEKKHENPARAVVWFGYHGNHRVLDQVLPTLKRLNLGLTVVSDLPYYPAGGIAGINEAWFNSNVRNIKYDAETANQDIVEGGDMVINPKLTEGRFKFKSENKTYISWALGMPVAYTSEDLERFIDPAERQKEAESRRKEVEEKWRTEISVEEYKKVINDILQSR